MLKLLMGFFALKTIISGILIALISELGKKFQFVAAILASLPLLSILAMMWMYVEGEQLEKISQLSLGIFWMVIPSLGFFLMLPFFIKLGIHFGWALLLSCALTAIFYYLYVFLLNKVGVQF